MNKRETFIQGVINYLKMSTSGALMISGAWGSGKTYFIDHTLVDHLKGDYWPVKISLFGLEKVDNLERLITEKFLADYGEEKDAAFYSADILPLPSYLLLQPGYFAIFFPQDGHMPQLSVDKPTMVKKIVVKVEMG